MKKVSTSTTVQSTGADLGRGETHATVTHGREENSTRAHGSGQDQRTWMISLDSLFTMVDRSLSHSTGTVKRPP